MPLEVLVLSLLRKMVMVSKQIPFLGTRSNLLFIDSPIGSRWSYSNSRVIIITEMIALIKYSLHSCKNGMKNIPSSSPKIYI
ncbi:hypothetical protein Gogos_022339 [Gossypium gossypioides]|uniref:Uncharacterized protein n=1 Tax=Gossypium gossypioides TaxID=34282 RepID=A0A7J9D6J6_GOSGO|nr:hypothetical protein [Gossypium gossypioides]